MKALSEQEEIIGFISFCIDHYKQKYDLNSTQVAQLFNQKKVIDFLRDNYEVLHCQPIQYIVKEIDLYTKLY